MDTIKKVKSYYAPKKHQKKNQTILYSIIRCLEVVCDTNDVIRQIDEVN